MNKFNLNKEQIEDIRQQLMVFVRRVSRGDAHNGEAEALPKIVKLLLDIPQTENLFFDFGEDEQGEGTCESENLRKSPFSGHRRTCEFACCRCFVRE